MDIIILKKLAPIFNQFFNFVYKPTNQNNNSNNKPMNELLLKVLCHNICVVIQEMMELGIKSEFVVEEKVNINKG